MRDQKEFYEKYWKHREVEGRLHDKKGMWIPERIKTAVKIIEDRTFNRKETISVLDIGCGEGTIGKLLKEKFGDKVSVIGCDISTTALKNAQIYYSDVYAIDVESDTFQFIRKFGEQKFDYVVVLEVLEHLFNPENVLEQVYAILKDDGILIASFPNIAWYKYRMDILRGHFPKNYLLYPGEHIQNFTLHSFCRLLRESKFSPVEINGQFVFPRIFKPRSLFTFIFKKFPNLFGYQLVVISKKEMKEKN
jgi:2-polyprenyl-3-methyl-5-hydroxy-6-metoxy-1,4-benzoquinol methylase